MKEQKLRWNIKVSYGKTYTHNSNDVIHLLSLHALKLPILFDVFEWKALFRILNFMQYFSLYILTSRILLSSVNFALLSSCKYNGNWFKSFTWIRNVSGTLDNDDTNGTASDVCCCELRLLLPTIMHCIRHFTSYSIQSQVFGNISENAVLFSNIYIDGDLRTRFFEAFATRK